MDRTSQKQAPNIHLVPSEPAHIPELGRICYEAFKGISERHGFTPDFPNAEAGRSVIRTLVCRPDFYGVTALVDDKVSGSNFLSLSDSVSAVGPITVDPALQTLGVGKLLMKDVIREANARGIEQVRLLQDAFNTASISLYTSLGFTVKNAVALLRPRPASASDPTIRDATLEDVEAMDALCQRIYRVSRKNEVAGAIRAGLPTLLRIRDGRILAYLIPIIFGHGVGTDALDLLSLAQEAARRSPDSATVFVPMDDGETFRAFLAAQARTVKMMNLMAMGPYDAPERVWLPSVLY